MRRCAALLLEALLLRPSASVSLGRRAFGLGAASASSGASATRRAPLMSMTVDSHVHVWSSSAAYAAGREPPAALGDSVACAEALLASMAAAGVDAALIVQPINYEYDHSHVSAVLGKYPDRFKGMLLANPTLDPKDAAECIHALADQGFTGVRFNPYLWPEDTQKQDWLADATGRALFEACGKRKMPVGVMAFQGLVPLLPSLEALMRVFPETVVVLDHFAFPRAEPGAGPNGQKFDEGAWKALLSLGQQYPQLHVKISALSRVASTADLADLEERVDELVTVYGSSRLMYGSDFPFCALQPGGYAAPMDAVRRWTTKLPEAEQADILGGTARRLFWLPECDGP
ncbi:hypothetical protein M885DRAFT_511703 [Pelagophyceae sp. CCMP2097]|nr:hypothetical protein M885DRAFT_511703 [Pelagophyceae sp. CCMP2097]|mmetsp:Transcript_10705/g.35565  ORF Transcript_10705/g.35565 Transcript_10705/m.35565 type:complete len:345 (+) Transcript_10705:51-1085(+)